MTAFVVGFSEVKLTLPIGIPLASGLNIAEVAGGDMYARAMVIQQDDYAVAILSCDLFGLPGRFVTEIRNVAFSATKHQIEELAIMITATHTHQGPALPKLFPVFTAIESPPLSIKYDSEHLTRQLGEQLAVAIIHAWNKRQPAVLKIGSGRLSQDTLHSRRPWDPRAGEPDLEILTLSVQLDDAVVGVLYNIGTHPLNEGGSKTYDADIFGMISTEMKHRFGNKGIFIPLVGASGNINPGASQDFSKMLGISIYSPPTSIVQDICNGIESGLMNSTPVDGKALRVVVKLITIPIAEPDFADNFSFLRITGNDPNFNIDTQVQAIQIGKILIVGLPGEPMAILGQKIKTMGEKLGFQKVLVAALANDFIGYYFTPESYDAGGYETLFCAHRNAGNIILSGVEDVLEKVKNMEEEESN